MKYMMLIYETPEDFETRTIDKTDPRIAAWRAYYQALVKSGVYVDGQPLQDVSSATTVRLRNGKRHVQDGPYADTKEQLGGFIILDLPSLDEALEWAARCPVAETGVLEVRPLAPEIHKAVVS